MRVWANSSSSHCRLIFYSGYESKLVISAGCQSVHHTKGAYDGDSLQGSCNSGRLTLDWRHLSKLKRVHSKYDRAICRGGIKALLCNAKVGSASRKEKVMTHQTSQNSPPSPLLAYGKWNAPPPPLHSLRRSSSWQAAGSGSGLMFISGIFHSTLYGPIQQMALIKQGDI